MAEGSDLEVDVLENPEELVERLGKDVSELYLYRDYFFEHNPIELATEKNECVEKKKKELLEKFDAIDFNQIPVCYRARLLYLKGRCYNVSAVYDERSTICLSKAVKLNPHLVNAWNELGESYWKNLNIKEAKASFEGALKHIRNPMSLRCLSIILRQETGNMKLPEVTAAILKSVELAKEAVAQNTKDGVSWIVLGNAYLCQFFTISQDPATLKSCISAYKQAVLDPVAKGQPDLYYNKGIAQKYEESYDDALATFEYAVKLDPRWQPPTTELNKLKQYLFSTNELVRTKGKIKAKKLAQMVQSLDKKMLGGYDAELLHTIGNRRNVSFELTRIGDLQEGPNEGKVILGRVIGSIYNESSVPFTFALVDDSMQCACVTVYNWANGRGAIIGDCVAIPEPFMRIHKHDSPHMKYNYKSIRVNTPIQLLVNGKRVGRNQLACTRVSSTYEIH